MDEDESAALAQAMQMSLQQGNTNTSTDNHTNTTQPAAAATTTATTTEPELRSEHKEMVQALADLGFSQTQGHAALTRTGFASLEQAIAWLLDNPEVYLQSNCSLLLWGGIPPAFPAMMKEFVASTNPKRYKMVLLVRSDLKMSVGKTAAQCSHATLGLFKLLAFPADGALVTMPRLTSRFAGTDVAAAAVKLLGVWDNQGEPTITLQVTDEKEMLACQQKAAALGLPSYVVMDAGRTEVAAGSRTVLSIIGPNTIVDQVSGTLKLLR